MLKMKMPDSRIIIPKLLKWNNSLTNFAEIITGIADAINWGNANQKDIQEYFEFIFQVKIGNLSEKIGNIYIRKNKPLYIEKVKDDIIKKLEK